MVLQVWEPLLQRAKKKLSPRVWNYEPMLLAKSTAYWNNWGPQVRWRSLINVPYQYRMSCSLWRGTFGDHTWGRVLHPQAQSSTQENSSSYGMSGGPQEWPRDSFMFLRARAVVQVSHRTKHCVSPGRIQSSVAQRAVLRITLELLPVQIQICGPHPDLPNWFVELGTKNLNS